MHGKWYLFVLLICISLMMSYFEHHFICFWPFVVFLLFISFFKDFIYLLMRDTETEREAETQAEREAGFMQGIRCGT